MKYSVIYNILFIICLVGCTNSELERAKLEIEEAKATINNLHVENQKIRQDALKLKGDFKASKMKNERLSIRIKELNEWSKKLTDGYGTGIWITDESTYPVFIKSMKSANVNDIIKVLNQIYEKNRLPKVVFKKIDGRKAYVVVEDSEHLTQRMGTSGASSYLKEVSYSICSVKNIDCVNIDFEEGDHAFPGDYCR